MAEDYARALEMLEQVGPSATPRGAHAVIQHATMMAVKLDRERRAPQTRDPHGVRVAQVHDFVVAPLVQAEVGCFPGTLAWGATYDSVP
jgi:hypothetical protein